MKPMSPEFLSGSGDRSSLGSSKRKQTVAPPPEAPPQVVEKLSKRKQTVAPPPEAPPQVVEKLTPRIIYEVEPKVIHTTAKDFKRVVQLLTGMPIERGRAAVGNHSPAAEATTRPSKPERILTGNSGAEYVYDGSNLVLRDFIGETGVELSRVPGISTQPPPMTLPPISPPLDLEYNIPTLTLGQLDEYMMENNKMHPEYNIPTSTLRPLDEYMMEYNKMQTNMALLDPYMPVRSPSTVSSSSVRQAPSSSSSCDQFNP